ncbi:MAG TPA: PQQ-binding-like beta-propeller repeat protein [Bryobacteraceae bacterium]|nr:PQQ-binding-like beta-propeller repeat protein [Bryobacteraceae bacterium]
MKLRWKVTVGEGHASPILAGGRIYAFTRQQDKETSWAVDPENGKVIWQQSYAAPYTMHPAAVSHGQGPKSTPVFAGGRLYTLGISGILTCWDAANGTVKWRKEFTREYRGTSPDFGAAMSPVVDRGLVMAHVGGHNDGALTAFDAASGVVKWRWTGDGPAYASPIVVELGGVRQVVTETQNNIVSVSVTNGQLLWRIPFTTQYDQNIPTPIVYHDELILSGISKGIMAVRAGEKDGKWVTETVWRNADVALYMSSPVAAGDLLFGFSHYKKGQLFCLDLRTGATQWTGEARQGDNAAVLISGENVIFLKDDAEMIIAKATGKGFEPLHTYSVAQNPTWAHPLVLRDGVVIKDATTLARWSAN